MRYVKMILAFPFAVVIFLIIIIIGTISDVTNRRVLWIKLVKKK